MIVFVSVIIAAKLALLIFSWHLTFNYQKADNKIFVCKFSKNVKSKLHHTENSKTRGQTV